MSIGVLGRHSSWLFCLAVNTLIGSVVDEGFVGTVSFYRILVAFVYFVSVFGKSTDFLYKIISSL